MPTPTVYTMLWPQWVCERLREHGLEETPLRFVFGGHNAATNFAHFKVGPGDVLVPLHLSEGALCPVARMTVTAKGALDDYLRAHPGDRRYATHDCDGQYLAGEGGTPITFDHAISPALARAWRFDGSEGPRPIKHLGPDGRVKQSLSLQGVYRLTPGTAKAVLAHIARGPKVPRVSGPSGGRRA